MKLKERFQNKWYFIGLLATNLFFKLFYKLRVYGRENIPDKQAVLFVCNHQSFFDPLLCGVTVNRELYYLARDTLFKKRFMNWFLNSINVIPVRRGEADLAAMRYIIAKLKAGRSACLFPEATRTRDGKITEFKPGFGLLCRRGNACIVPIVLDGAFECWPRQKKMFSIWKKITVSYGQCITVEKIKKMNDRELAKSLTNTLRQMQTEVRIKEKKEPYEY